MYNNESAKKQVTEMYMNALRQVHNLPAAQKDILFEYCYSTIKGELARYLNNNQYVSVPDLLFGVAIQSAMIDDNVSLSEVKAVDKIARITGFAPNGINPQYAQSLMNHPEHSDNSGGLFDPVQISRCLSPEARGFFFTLVAAICSYDNDITQPEFKFLYKVFTAGA